MAIVENAASDVAKQRARTRNAPKMTFQDDIVERSLAIWAASSLKLTYGSEGQLDVTSYSYHTETNKDYLMDKSCGNIYCKLLAPYRAMEWYYLDSLKTQSIYFLAP